MNIAQSPSENHPRFANHIVGHGSIIDQLTSAYKRGRLPHGLLFTGPKGVGKATVAHQIARALLSQSMDQLGEPCKAPLTSTDHLLRAGNHPDFISIEKKPDEKGKMPKDISVEKIRSVVHFFSQTSLENNWRIAIIDSIDDLTPKSANTLLKILEEPPQKCLLILISQNLESVLPTLRSRAQIIQFPPLSPEDTKVVLEQRELTDASFLASISGGRPGLGFLINDLGGRIFYETFLHVIKDLLKQDLRSTYPFIETFILKHTTLTDEQAWSSFFNFLNHWIAHTLSQEQRNKGQGLLSNRSPDQWVDSWFAIQETLRATHVFSLDKKQTLLCIFHELAGLHQR